jgi:N,N'-diacetyllegionaminate synthase
MSTFVIAELGSCHDNSLVEAINLMELAKDCGANAAKFQFWSSAKRMAQRRNAPNYEAMYERVRLAIDLRALKRAADTIGIEFMCSTFLPEDVPTVAPLVKTMKIASFEANDPQHLVAHLPCLLEGKRILISMGLDARWSVVEKFLIGFAPWKAGPCPVVPLRCVSAYPAPIKEFQLIRLRGGSNECGLSDHSDPENQLMGALAVAAGATVVERHLRSNTTRNDNPDYPHAMSPAGFAVYVANIRMAEEALKGMIGMSAPSEAPLRALRTWKESE